MKTLLFMAALVIAIFAGVAFAFLLDNLETGNVKLIIGYFCATKYAAITSCILWQCYYLFKSLSV